MLKTIADEKVYTVSVDTSENRLYITIRGIWKDADARSYAEHVKQLISQARPGFAILMDMTKAAPQMPWIQDVSVELQGVALKAGLKKIAEVFDGQVITEDQRAKTAAKSGITRKTFNNFPDARAWLDEK